MDISKLWAVEYSISQGFFQIDKLSEALKINRHGIRNGCQRDYLILHVDEDYSGCFEFARRWRETEPCPNLHHLYSQSVI